MDRTEASGPPRESDLGALEQILEQYGDMMAYVVRGILPDPHETEECLARIRLRLWEKLASYREERASLATWITTLCRNMALDRLRQLRRDGAYTAPLENWAPDPAPGPEELYLRQERRAQLQKAIAALNRRERELVYRKYFYLQSTAQIAAEMGLSSRSVEGRLYRIRSRLRTLLGGDFFEPI